jgi:lipopolysaccharide transport system ATP-binding protein
MPAITRMCKRAILLNKGEVVEEGEAHDVVNHYLHAGHIRCCEEWPDVSQAPGNDIVRLRAVRVKSESGQVTDVVDIRNPMRVEIEYDILKPGHMIVPQFGFNTEEDIIAFIVNDRDPAWYRRPRPVGSYTSTAWIPGNFLSEGTMVVGGGLFSEDPWHEHCDVPRVVGFRVVDPGTGDTARGDVTGHWEGVVRPLFKWTTEHAPLWQR